MKTLKTIITVMGIVAMLGACAPADEDPQPNFNDKDLEKFEVKSNTGGGPSESDPPSKP